MYYYYKAGRLLICKKILTSLLLSLGILIALLSCGKRADYSLDESIPRLQSPVDQIAFLRTKWLNGRHIETVFYDRQDRVLEVFSFGRSCSKVLNYYEGNLQIRTVRYEHSDSSGPGFATIDSLVREFDAHGRLVMESHYYYMFSDFELYETSNSSKCYLDYAVNGDTIFKKQESSLPPGSSQLINISRWERDNKKQIKRYYRLYVTNGSAKNRPDTMYHFSQNFSYDTRGKLKMAWFDSMYLGQFFWVAGPDTTWYRYDSENRLVEEKQRYTTNMRNKRAIDSTALSPSDRQSVNWHKERFFVSGDNDRTDLIEYRYEKFDPAKHQKLAIPPPN